MSNHAGKQVILIYMNLIFPCTKLSNMTLDLKNYLSVVKIKLHGANFTYIAM